MTSPRWSLITVTYNSAEALRRFEVGRGVGDDVEWIIVDNASVDDSVDVGRSYGARIIELRENRGFSRANNVGLAAASGRYVGFVNPDLAVRGADLPRIAAHLDRGREHLVVPQLLGPDGRDQPNGRGVPTVVRKVRNRSASPSTGYRVVAEPGEDRYVAWAMGAAVFGLRGTFEALAGWDERFFVYYEDHDLGLRAWRRGVPVVLHGGIRWVHGWARETTELRVRPWMLEIQGAWKFYTRYPHLLLHHKLHARRDPEFRFAVGRRTTEFV
ncbi:glycosyltransferase [Georgenia deserti]|uniref:Glycosyltransferase n=1 Tax=Georgenia deserti TaxID=2093781 RepID=A0ABW4L3H5_9MICO